MIFGEVPVEEAENAVLAHTLRVESLTIKKGVPLSAADVRALIKAGVPPCWWPGSRTGT